jgi:Tfp pilus assembly major pilin PilA
MRKIFVTELVITVIIIGIVAAISIPSLICAKEKAGLEKALLEKASPSNTDMVVWNRLTGPSHGDDWSATVYWVVNPTTKDTVYLLPFHGIFVLPAKPVTAEATK